MLQTKTRMRTVSVLMGMLVTGATMFSFAPVAGANGANGNCGAYCPTPSQPGDHGKQPADGSKGKADSKNPPGQAPNGSDHNKGYECDNNNGVGQGNPAHTGCSSSPTTIPSSNKCDDDKSCTTTPPNSPPTTKPEEPTKPEEQCEGNMGNGTNERCVPAITHGSIGTPPSTSETPTAVTGASSSGPLTLSGPPSSPATGASVLMGPPTLATATQTPSPRQGLAFTGASTILLVFAGIALLISGLVFLAFGIKPKGTHFM